MNCLVRKAISSLRHKLISTHMLAGLLAAADAFSSSSPACEVVHFSGAYVKDPSWPLYTAQGYIKGEGVQDKRDAPTGDKEHIYFSCGEGGPLAYVKTKESHSLFTQTPAFYSNLLLCVQEPWKLDSIKCTYTNQLSQETYQATKVRCASIALSPAHELSSAAAAAIVGLRRLRRHGGCDRLRGVRQRVRQRRAADRKRPLLHAGDGAEIRARARLGGAALLVGRHRPSLSAALRPRREAHAHARPPFLRRARGNGSQWGRRAGAGAFLCYRSSARGDPHSATRCVRV